MGQPKNTVRPSVHSSLNDPTWLRARYVDDRLTLGEIADLAGVPNGNRTTVRRALIRAGIPVRTISEAKTGRTHKGTPKSPETRAKIAASRRGKPGPHWTEEQRAEKSRQSRAAWADPAKREMQSRMKRGERNPMYGTVSPNRGPDYTPDHLEAGRRRSRKHSTGITHAEFDRMLAEQHGVCAICGQTETISHTRAGTIKALAVDHDHQTGRIRGLLCHRCNVAIGLLREDRDLFAAAVAYLDHYREAT
jgi:hypothetical protein